MPELDYVPEYLTEDMAEWMIREFGTDENGEMTGIHVKTDEQGFILAESSVRKLEKQEIDSLSRYEMFLAVQEIYARNGKKFDDVMLYGYFHEKPWYEPYEQVLDENDLTKTERYNIERLTEAGDLGEMAQVAYGNNMNLKNTYTGSEGGIQAYGAENWLQTGKGCKEETGYPFFQITGSAVIILMRLLLNLKIVEWSGVKRYVKELSQVQNVFDEMIVNDAVALRNSANILNLKNERPHFCYQHMEYKNIEGAVI